MTIALLDLSSFVLGKYLPRILKIKRNSSVKRAKKNKQCCIHENFITIVIDLISL